MGESMSQTRSAASVSQIDSAFVLGPEKGQNRCAAIFDAAWGGEAARAYRYRPRQPGGIDLLDPNGARGDYLAGRERFLELGEAWSDIQSDHVDPVECVARVENDISGWIITRGGGRTLQDLLDGGGGLDAEAVCKLAMGLAQGLRDLHDASLCHLNLSPGAILLLDEGAPEACRLTGLAPDERAYAKIFKSTKTLGEPGFSPPELQDGSGKSKLGPATDIYGASAVLYRLVAGKPLPDWRQTADYEQAIEALDGGDDYPAAFVAAIKAGLALDYQVRSDKADQWHKALTDTAAKKPAAKKRAADPVADTIPAEPETPEPDAEVKERDAALLPEVVKTEPETDINNGNGSGQNNQNNSGQRRVPPPPVLPPALIAMAAAFGAIVLLLGGWLLIRSMVTPRYDLILSGSSTVGEKLAPELVKTWMETNGYSDIKTDERKVTATVSAVAGPEEHSEFDISGKKDGKTYRVEIKAAGTGAGFKEAQTKGAVDIVMASRPIKSDEISALSSIGDFGSASAEHALSYDGIAIVVASGNSVERLTTSQVHDIFSGRITDWGEVGGTSGHHINLYSRDENSGTYDTFHDKVMGSDSIATARLFSAGSALEAAVASDPDGIGYVSMSAVKTTKALSIAAAYDTYDYFPNSYSVSSGLYPIYRKLYFYAPPYSSKPDVSSFLTFVESQAGRAVVSKSGQAGLSLQEGGQGWWHDQTYGLSFNIPYFLSRDASQAWQRRQVHDELG
jgi:phosphate binding protein